MPPTPSSKTAPSQRASLDLGHLRYFQAIAKSGSLTQAARQLSVSQPTLTVAIRNLEERFRTTLLLRDHGGVTLSSTGQELLRCSEEIFAELERTEQRILGMETAEAGSFVVGCHESLGAYFLPELMSGLFRTAPHIEITLWNGTSAGVRQAVLDREVHFGLVVNPVPHPDLVLVELFRDAVFICVEGGLAPREPGEAGLAAAHELLRKGPLIYAGRVSQCQELVGRLAAGGLLPQRTLVCGDLELVKSLALAGLGVALLPRRVAAYGHEGRLRPLHQALPSIPDTIYLLYRGDMHRTRAALRLKEILVNYGKTLDEQDE